MKVNSSLEVENTVVKLRKSLKEMKQSGQYLLHKDYWKLKYPNILENLQNEYKNRPEGYCMDAYNLIKELQNNFNKLETVVEHVFQNNLDLRKQMKQINNEERLEENRISMLQKKIMKLEKKLNICEDLLKQKDQIINTALVIY